MAKKKVYAVRRGKTTGLFYSWSECEAAVSGYPGAEYKGFLTEDEAKKYLGYEDIKAENEDVLNKENFSLIAYVDGSFDAAIGKYAFGCVILTPDGDIIKESGNGDNPESLAIRNVAGEMLGAMTAVRWAIKNGYDNLELRYDYEGIEKWATGVWKAKNTLTQKYAEYMQRQQNHIKISFRKVKAHSGDYYNEEADKLAKEALKM
ncbi:MAG: viroplasmin family protein [Oliverpabstia sp.]